MNILPLVHVCAATVGLLSGYMSMLLRKGSNLHRATGSVFVVSMLAMSSSAAYIAAFMRPNRLNVVVGLLTFYLVATAWWAARRRDGRRGAFDLSALIFIAAVALMGIAAGLEAAGSPEGTKDQMPAFIYFIFGSIALLCAITDVRLLLRGGFLGVRRMARHLWRMSLALLIATFSLYPGQARLFSPELRESKILILPHLFLIASMVFWMIRVRRRRGAQLTTEPVAEHSGSAMNGVAEGRA